MNACLINPPRLLIPFSAAARPGLPLGLAYIAGSLAASGHKVSVIDSLALGYEQHLPFHREIIWNGLTVQQIIDLIPTDTELIGISCMFSGNWLASRDLIDAIGKTFTKAVIVIGGEHVTSIPEYCLQDAPELDICVMGEGEGTIADIANAIENGLPYNTLSGIVFRDVDGGIVRNEKRDRLRKLDSIPRPAWEKFPLETYAVHDMSDGVANSRSLPIMATRGCPYTCTFCSSPQMWTTKYSMRTPADVVDEMQNLHELYGVKNFDFYDLTAIVKRTWIIDFTKEIINRKLNITWQTPAGTRSEVIDDEVASLMYQSGCFNMVYAPESGSDKMLNLIQKKVHLDKLLKSIVASKRQGLSVKLNIIVGFPDETHKDVWKTIWFMIKASWYGADDALPSIFNPYPGSELFRQLQHKGKVSLSDDYFYEIPYADSFTQSPVYANKISPFWVRAYVIIGLLMFYGSNYLFRPNRLFRTIKNVMRQNLTTRGEMYLSELLRRNIKNKAKQSSETLTAVS